MADLSCSCGLPHGKARSHVYATRSLLIRARTHQLTCSRRFCATVR